MRLIEALLMKGTDQALIAHAKKLKELDDNDSLQNHQWYDLRERVIRVEARLPALEKELARRIATEQERLIPSHVQRLVTAIIKGKQMDPEQGGVWLDSFTEKELIMVRDEVIRWHDANDDCEYCP